MHWRLLVSPPMNGPENMALDHALMGRARRTGEAVLRVYGWSMPVLSLGRNQPARDSYDDVMLAERGVAVVRRPTGGRALLHHRELTYSVTAPATAAMGLTTIYQRINHLLVDALTAMGVPAALAQPHPRAHKPTAVPCFDAPAAGEVVVGARKLAGSAQWRDGDALLQHGSVLVDDDQALIPLLMREPAAPAPAPATLRGLLERAPDLDEFASAMFAAVRRREDAAATQLAGHADCDAERRVLLAHYADEAWTWRR